MKRTEILRLKKGDRVIYLTGDDSHPEIMTLNKDPWEIPHDELFFYYPATKDGVEEWRQMEILSLDRQMNLPTKSCFVRMTKERRDRKADVVNETAADLYECISAMNRSEADAERKQS